MDGFEMVERNDFDSFKDYVKYNNINAINKYGYPLLEVCVRLHRVEMLRLLLEANVRVNRADKDGNTALHIACMMGMKDIVQILLHFKANIELENHAGERPIFLAVQKNSLDIVQILENSHARMDTLNKNKENLMFYAIRSGSMEMLNYIYSKNIFSLNKQNDSLESYMHIACKINQQEMVNWLLEHKMKYFMKNKNQESPLYYAARYSNVDINQILVFAGLSFEEINQQGHTVIDCIERKLILDFYSHVIENTSFQAYYKKYKIFYSIQNKNIKEVKSIINENKAFCNKNEYGFTLLDFALESKNRDLIRLIEAYKK